MKRFAICIIVLALLLTFVGCRKEEPEKNAVYSFSGECEQFSVINGVAVIGDAEELFSAGDLKVNEGYLQNLASYTATFYVIVNGERRVILTNSVVDMTGGSVNFSGDLGQVSGQGVLTGRGFVSDSDFKDNLYFELITADLTEKENTYQIQLSVNELT